MCNTRKKRVKEHQSKLPQSDRHPTRADERACCGIGIHSDRQGHPKEHGTGQERQEPLPVSILVGYSVQTFTKYVKFERFMCGGVIILPMPEKRIQRHCRAVTSDSENLLRYRDRNIKASCHNQTDTQQEPMKEPVAVSVSIQTDKDTRKSLAVSEQGRHTAVSFLVIFSSFGEPMAI